MTSQNSHLLMLVRTFTNAAVAVTAASTTLAAQSRPAAPPPSSAIVARVIAAVQSGGMQHREPILQALSTAGQRDSTTVVALLSRLHIQGAPFVVLKVDSVGRHAFTRLKSPRTGRTVTVDIATDREDHTRVGSVDVLESHAAALDELTWTAPAADDSSMARLIASNLKKLETAGALSGVAYVLKGDTPIHASGYGYANVEDSIPNGLHTRFALASMGKMFTATGILQLVDARKLRLDDTLAQVLPRYPNAERARQITIRNLLEHSAGLGDLWSTPKKPVAGLTGALGYAASVAHAPLLFAPGTRWSYSNEGYAVLAAVIEELTGEDFQSYVQHHILGPAGMTETSLRNGSDDIVPHRAVGYRPAEDDPLGNGPVRANWSFITGSSSGGAGGGYSTVLDLARFGRALRTGTLISERSRNEMWTGRWDVTGFPDEKYGYGSFVMKLNGHTIVGHGGGGTGSGMDSGFRQFTDGSYTVVVLTNIDPPSGTILTSRIVRLLAEAHE